MKIHELTLAPNQSPTRKGRGIGSGKGKTAGLGTKGQNARTGGGVRPGFEGGQNPLAKRLPKKRGFQSISPKLFQVVNLEQLTAYKAGQTVDNASLASKGLVKRADRPVKLLGNGKLTVKLTVKVQAASASAQAAVKAASGQIELTPPPAKPQPTKRAKTP